MSYRPEEFSVGDIVRIRKYEDMLEECGAQYRSDVGPTSIPVNSAVYFASEMKKYCGHTYTIVGIHSGIRYTIVRLRANKGSPNPDGWTFVTEMIEPFDAASLPEIEAGALEAVLGLE